MAMTLGSEKLFSANLKVGPFTLFFNGIRSEFSDSFLKRYSHFITESSKFDFSVELVEKEDNFLKDDSGYLRLEEKFENNKKVLISTSFKGYEVDENGVSKLIVSPICTETSYFTRFENHFRWVVANEVMKRGGFLLHSSGITKNDNCVIFFGSSGDGKSTIVELGKKRGGRILSDDLIIVYPQKELYIAYGAPFYGVLPQNEKEKVPYKIKSIYRLRKSEENRVKTISKGEALGLILSHCQFVFSEKVRNEMLLPIVFKFISKVSCYELFFRKEDTFWDLI